MDDSQFEAVAQLVFMWIGFGTVVGLAAKAIMPGRDPGGSVAPLIMGIIGTVIGCALLKYFCPDFCVGTGGAFVLLSTYKILGGYWFSEGEQMTHFHMRRFWRGRRSRRAMLEDL